MTIDLKTISADTTFGSGAFLFGADSQSASEPSLYSESTVFGYLLGLANTWTNSQTINTGEKTASAPILDMSQTWNNGAVTFTGIKSNVTDTASASGSLLMDLQVGGSSKFKVTKNGSVNIPDNSELVFAGNGRVTRQSGAGGLYLASDNNIYANIGALGTLVCNGGIAVGSTDLFLARKAAANLRLGAADAASPVAQTLGVQSVVAGTTNTAGANFTIAGSQGTGTGAGGSIIFQVAPAGSSGTAQNALVDALTINSDRTVRLHSLGSGLKPNIYWNTVPGVLTNWGIFSGAVDTISMGFSNGEYIRFTNLGIQTHTNLSIGPTMGSPDVLLARDAANTLALRNGTNAQAFNIYNTYTDASNYERGFVKWDTNVLKIGTEKLGTGTARALEFQTDGTTRLTISSNGGATFAGLPIVSNGVIRLANSDGDITLSGGVIYIPNTTRLGIGGSTSSFPALKRSSTTLQSRLADDSGFASIQGKLTTETAYTAGAPTATGYIVLYDSTGTAYKVPAEAL